MVLQVIELACRRRGPAGRSVLPDQAEAGFDAARGVGLRANRAKCGVGRIGLRIPEGHAIGQVECLYAELYVAILAELEALAQRTVELFGHIAAQFVELV